MFQASLPGRGSLGRGLPASELAGYCQWSRWDREGLRTQPGDVQRYGDIMLLR